MDGTGSLTGLHTEQGASAIEYAFLAAFIAGLIVAIVVLIGRQTCENFEVTSNARAAADGDPPGTQCVES